MEGPPVPSEVESGFCLLAGVLPLPFALADSGGRLLRWNDAFARSVGDVLAPGGRLDLLFGPIPELEEVWEGRPASFLRRTGERCSGRWLARKVAAGFLVLMGEPPDVSTEPPLPEKPASRLMDFEALCRALEFSEETAAVFDPQGRLLACNAGWKGWRLMLEGAHGPRPQDGPPDLFAQLGAVFGESAAEKETLLGGVRSVATAETSVFEREVAFASARRRRWFRLVARALPGRAFLLVLQEITETHRLRQDLRESHALFRHFSENISDGIFLYDKESRFILTNGVYAETLGFTAAQLAGRSLFEVFKPDLAQTEHEQNLLVLSTGQTLHFELLVDTPRGSRRVFVTKHPYRNHRNEIFGVLGVVRDISDHAQVEESLIKNERHFRALIESSADRVSLLTRDATIKYVSPSTKRILGFDIEELVGTHAFLWVCPSDLPMITRRFNELLEMPGASITSEYRALRKDGRWQWMEATATNLLEDASVNAIVVNERDISERKEAEAELTRYAQIVTSNHDAIIAADTDGTVTSWNPAAESIFGYTSREIVGRNIETLVPESGREESAARRARALAGKGADTEESVFLAKDGRLIDVSLTLSPIRDRDRRVIGFSKIIRDITERRQLEREILEISDREKQRLGQDLHDDLCQQLVGISLLSNLLQQELSKLGLPQAGEAGQITRLVSEAVEHARNLARGLFPLHLLDTGFISALQMLAANTEQMFRTPCVFECGTMFVMKDEALATHLYRIAQEALHNAVKHSQASRIVLSLDRSESGFRLEVCDDGIGIPEEKLSPHTSGPGSLGMHTMRYRARLIGATVEIHRNPQGGTCVACNVPNSAGWEAANAPG